MNVYEIWRISETERVTWYFDEDYDPVGNFATGDDDLDERLVSEEVAALNDGSLVVLGYQHERKCPECGELRHIDSCWGIVIEPDDTKLRDFAEWSDLPLPEEVAA